MRVQRIDTNQRLRLTRRARFNEQVTEGKGMFSGDDLKCEVLMG